MGRARSYLALAIVVLLWTLALQVGPAQATCSATVQVFNIKTYSSGGAIVYGKPLFNVMPAYVYYWTISYDDRIAENEVFTACQVAWASGKPVYIIGDASECPTNEAYRYGGKVFFMEGGH